MHDPDKRWGILFGVVLSFLPATAMAQAPATGAASTIQGRIIDAESLDPVPTVVVELVGTDLRITTERDGRFVLQGVPAGNRALRATRMGYKPLSQGVLVAEGDTLTLELRMDRLVLQLAEITVTPGAYTFMEAGTALRQTMSREDIESVPQLGEDVFRAVNRLPGLSSGDYSAHFSIRGGRHDETLILLDGLELYEPYHLKDFNEGAISIVDAEAIDGVQLLTGGFPAQYGNKRSGVFDISSRTPERDRTHYSLGLSFMNARATARGPLLKGKGAWLVSARSGYMDLVFNLIKQDELPSPRYHDVFAKMQMDLSPNHSLLLDLLHAGDRYTFDAPSTTGFQDSIQTREKAHNRYGNSYAWATLRSKLGARTSVKTMVSTGLVTRSRDGAERYVSPELILYTFKNDRDFTISGFKQDWSHELAKSYLLSWGVDARRLHSNDKLSSVVNEDPNDPNPIGTFPVITNTDIGKTGTRLGLYLSNRVKVIDPLILEVGGRYDRATYTGDDDFSPRASAALSIGEGRTLRVGWGQYRQIQGIDEVAALDTTNRYFRSELSEQWTTGLEQRLANGALLRVEAYFKEGSRLRPAYRNWKSGIDAFPEANEDRILVFPKKTTAKGLELYFDHKLGDRLAMRASYALSDTREEVDRIVNINSADTLTFDQEHPTTQDQRHAANVDFTYKWRRAWSINSSFAFHTGWPATHERLVQFTDEDGEIDYTVRPEKIYGARLPSYFRWDMRATRRWTNRWGDMRFFVELVNLTNHSNVFGYDYIRAHGVGGNIVLERNDETWFTVLPSVGVAWSSSF